MRARKAASATDRPNGSPVSSREASLSAPARARSDGFGGEVGQVGAGGSSCLMVIPLGLVRRLAVLILPGRSCCFGLAPGTFAVRVDLRAAGLPLPYVLRARERSAASVGAASKCRTPPSVSASLSSMKHSIDDSDPSESSA